MVSDLRLLRVLHALAIDAGPYPASSVTGYVVVTGVRVVDTTRAYVDGSPAPFRVISANKVIVKASPQSDIALFTIYPTSTGEAQLTVDMGVRTALTSSPLETLKQRVVKTLLSDVYSDAFYSLGAGVDRLAGSSLNNQLVSEAVGRVRDAEQQLLDAQGSEEPDESALDYINILGAEADGPQGARLTIEIYNRAGQRVQAEV